MLHFCGRFLDLERKCFPSASPDLEGTQFFSRGKRHKNAFRMSGCRFPLQWNGPTQKPRTRNPEASKHIMPLQSQRVGSSSVCEVHSSACPVRSWRCPSHAGRFGPSAKCFLPTKLRGGLRIRGARSEPTLPRTWSPRVPKRDRTPPYFGPSRASYRFRLSFWKGIHRRRSCLFR